MGLHFVHDACLWLGGALLWGYPLMLMANVMAFAGVSETRKPKRVALAAYTFMLGTTLYPAVYFVAEYRASSGDPARDAMLGALPLGYLLFCFFGLGALWDWADKSVVRE